MMGHRERLSGGDEWDAFSRRAKRYLHWRPGERARIKRKFNKRQRKENAHDDRRDESAAHLQSGKSLGG
jgi:hypothetical protein